MYVKITIEEKLGIDGIRATHGVKRGPWNYATHHNSYILMLDCGLPNHYVCCNGDLDYIGCSLTPALGVQNTFHQCG